MDEESINIAPNEAKIMIRISFIFFVFVQGKMHKPKYLEMQSGRKALPHPKMCFGWFGYCK
jgi:hypothetical protein